jgi:peroxin-12
LKRKLDAAHEADAPRVLLGAAYSRLPPNPTPRDRLGHAGRWFLRRVYPSVSAAYGFALLAFQLAYLADRSAVHSPLLWLAGTRMRRLGPADYSAIAAANSTTPPAAASSRLRALTLPMLSGLRLVLPVSIFALKFLEWWHASDFARQLSSKAAQGISLPPPLVTGLPRVCSHPTSPVNLDPSSSTASSLVGADPPPVCATTLRPILTVPAPKDSQLCPICEEEVQTATACQTGYVYCYVCIYRWVSGEHDRQVAFMAVRDGAWEIGKGRCAVTGRRVLGGTEGLRRVVA